MSGMCVVTNHRQDLHTTETTGNERFPIVLFWHAFLQVNNCFSFLFVYSMCYNSTEYRFEWLWNKSQSWCAQHTQQSATIDVELCWQSFQIEILRSRNFCRHGSLIEGSIVNPHKIPLFKKIFSTDYAVRNENITIVQFLSSCASDFPGTRYMEMWLLSRFIGF